MRVYVHTGVAQARLYVCAHFNVCAAHVLCVTSQQILCFCVCVHTHMHLSVQMIGKTVCVILFLCVLKEIVHKFTICVCTTCV